MSDCTGANSCPGIYELADGSFAVVGESPTGDRYTQVLNQARIVIDLEVEDVVVVSRDLLIAFARRLLAEVDDVR